MAKRFTDTEKWKKPFIRSLQAPYKLLWLYICDDCDHAGIWQVDMEVAMLRIGEKVTEEKALKILDKKVFSFDEGKKWFIPSFIEFQYPSGLNPANRTHHSIIQILLKNDLMEILKPLTSPLQGAKDKDKDMDKGSDIPDPRLLMNWDQDKKNFIQDTAWMMMFTTQKQISPKDLEFLMEYFVGELELKEDYKSHKEIKRHFTNWFVKIKPNVRELKKTKTQDESISNAPRPNAREKRDMELIASINGTSTTSGN